MTLTTAQKIKILSDKADIGMLCMGHFVNHREHKRVLELPGPQPPHPLRMAPIETIGTIHGIWQNFEKRREMFLSLNDKPIMGSGYNSQSEIDADVADFLEGAQVFAALSARVVSGLN